MSARSFHFTHAVVRTPGDTVAKGLRAVDTGTPDPVRFRQDHKAYIDALTAAGANVKRLESLNDYPDSVFIEDTALCLGEGAIVLRPGASSRLGEAGTVMPVLSEFYQNIARINGPGFIDGGDILVTEKEILVGLSSRTDEAGVEELKTLVDQWGYQVRSVRTPEGVLHFKTDCSLLDADTILSTKRLSASGCFSGYRVIHTAAGEEAAANSIRFNDRVIIPSGFPRTSEILSDAGYNVKEVGNAVAAKLDGGMSCLSLRFTPPE